MLSCAIMYSKTSRDDKLNPVQRASFCGTFRTHDTTVVNLDPRQPQIVIIYKEFHTRFESIFR